MITKDQVQKALGALDGHLPETVAKSGSDGDLNEAEGAAEGEGSLKAPGTSMAKKAPKGKTQKSLAKGEFPPKKDDDKKSDDEEEEDSESDDEEDEEDDEPKGKTKKSMPSSYLKGMPKEVTTKVEVSNFLRSLVDHTADSVDGLRDYVAKSDMANENRYDELGSAIEQVAKSLGNIGIVLRAVCERIGVIENQPAHVAKSVTAAPAAAAQPVARAFAEAQPGAAEAAASEGGMFKSLNGKPAHIAKAMVSEVLCDLVRKGEAKDTDVINFETFGFVPPELQPKLSAALN